MATFKTRGIIIKRSHFGEADRLVTIFSDKHGKIRMIAKGVRKPLSRLAGHIELFCLTDFLIAEGRNLDIVADAQTIKCYLGLRNRLESTKVAYYLAEIIDKMTGEEEPHPKIFALLEEVLENLNGEKATLMLPYFIFNFLAELGYEPELYKCLECGLRPDLKRNFFSYQEGGLLCLKCHQQDSPISEKAIKALRLILKHNLKLVKKIKTDVKLTSELENLAENFLKHIHQQEFKSRRFLTS